MPNEDLFILAKLKISIKRAGGHGWSLKRGSNTFNTKSNTFKVGLNSLANRLAYLNNEIPLEWLNKSIETFKIHCKKLYLSYT